MDPQRSIHMHLTFFPSDNLQIFIIDAGFILGEFVNEKGNVDCMDRLSSDEKVIVVVSDEAEEDKSGQHDDHLGGCRLTQVVIVLIGFFGVLRIPLPQKRTPTR
ncbi:unnamed protein product [Fraxinus pennsylvanica]|uniref:Uncharacterized protein n=1 Tax=Fraxinus pennsylvanica TaxID=56036 RepID=A0AAD1YP88_9LAMI|nr:unnamed protein product [Fraxinus pennsylvanica]